MRKPTVLIDHVNEKGRDFEKAERGTLKEAQGTSSPRANDSTLKSARK